MAEREDQLFKLIKSLSKAQKRYLKVNVTHVIGKQNNYMRLFDALDKMEHYDEEKLLLKFKDTNFIKHLPSEKNYLFELILKNMRTFNTDRTISFTIQSLIQDIFFLFEKGLLDSCLKRIRKAKKLCYSYGQYYYLLEILQWERKITVFYVTNEQVLNNVAKHDEIQAVLAVIQNEHSFQQLKDDLNYIFRRDFYNINEEKLEQLKLLIKNPLLNSIDNAKTFQAKRYYYACYSSYHRGLTEHEKELEYIKLAIDLWEETPHMIKEYVFLYKNALQTYASVSYMLGRFDQYQETLEKIKSLPAKSLKEEAEDFQSIYFLELYYYMNHAELDKALALVPEISESLLRFDVLINKPRLISFYYNIAIVYYLQGQFEDALIWINRITELKLDTRQDLQHFARVMQLILHYETSEPDIVEYIYGMTYRYLYKQDKINVFEKIIFTYIRKLNKARDKKSVNALLEVLIKELEQHKIEKPNTIGLEELICWIESKLTRQSIKSVAVRRLKAEMDSSPTK